MESTVKKLKWLSWILTILFIIFVLIPISSERFLNSRDGWKGLWTSFIALDEAGQYHMSQMFVTSVVGPIDGEFFQYAYQAPEGQDLKAWEKPVRGDDKNMKDGFEFADRGYLWSGKNLIGRGLMKDGSRLKPDLPFRERRDMSSISLPGAPWDIKTDRYSVFGTFPDFKVQYENENFKIDVVYRSRFPEWAMYNEGRPWRVGDFCYGSMNESFSKVEGTVTHKLQNTTFKIKGYGLLEDAVGLPWNWVDWGGHNWLEMHFPSGWCGMMMVMADDWQWGYHPTETGYIYDPERKEFHNFTRVEIVEREMGWDELNRREYPLRTKWMAISKGGTLHLETKNFTVKYEIMPIPYTPLSKKYEYGRNEHTAKFIRRDGTVVELKNGSGLQERFLPLFPDYRYIGPIFLILLILSWGATAAAARSRDKKSQRGVWVAVGVGIIWVFWLYWYWCGTLTHYN